MPAPPEQTAADLAETPAGVGDAPLDALPVLAERVERSPTRTARRLLSRRSDIEGAAIPAIQAAAVAAGSFVAGAAAAGLVHRRSRARALSAPGAGAGRSIARRRASRGAEALQIVGTQTLLVDVHVLGTPGSNRAGGTGR